MKIWFNCIKVSWLGPLLVHVQCNYVQIHFEGQRLLYIYSVSPKRCPFYKMVHCVMNIIITIHKTEQNPKTMHVWQIIPKIEADNSVFS